MPVYWVAPLSEIGNADAANFARPLPLPTITIICSSSWISSVFLLLFLLLLVLAEIMHHVFNWSLWGGHSRSYVNLVPVISEQTDSFEFLAVGSSNLFCRMLELPHCRRLPWSLDPFEVEVQNSSVLITSKQFCQVILFCSDTLCAESAIVACFLGFVILIGNLQQCTDARALHWVWWNVLGKKFTWFCQMTSSHGRKHSGILPFSTHPFLNASLHHYGTPLYLINVVFPWSLFHWAQKAFPCPVPKMGLAAYCYAKTTHQSNIVI